MTIWLVFQNPVTYTRGGWAGGSRVGGGEGGGEGGQLGAGYTFC